MRKITHIVPTWFPDETRERNAYQLGSALGSRVLRVGEGHDEADAYNDPQEEADEEPHWRSSCRGLPIRVYYGRGREERGDLDVLTRVPPPSMSARKSQSETDGVRWGPGLADGHVS
ncbi:hypothetical protein B296_00005072 [Ensete ventricosum]|uniref:Uncharacterized protein n=1 Tax=Ensete ventricosum TaxID=4639 RepID=A0A427B0L6_ENSVE|nr:hypothetical protein B296_00005072 [Ensete ventricosum]